jgi:hypothetical protein
MIRVECGEDAIDLQAARTRGGRTRRLSTALLAEAAVWAAEGANAR